MARRTKRPRPALTFEQLDQRQLLASDFSLIRNVTPQDTFLGGNNHLVVGDRIYYHHSGYLKAGLWVSDGTPEGTRLLSETRTVSRIYNVGSTVYFTAHDGLWKTDSTEMGTVRLTVGCCNPVFPRLLGVANGKLLMTRDDATIGTELWGTSPDTNTVSLVKDIWNEKDYGSMPQQMAEFKGELYFSAITNPIGRELWKSDGTAAGTVLVKDLDIDDGSPRLLVNANGTLYFEGNTDTQGRELWKSDGTTAGTVMVKDLNPGKDGSYISAMTGVGNQVFFVADTKIWKSDGTAQGTIILKSNVPYFDEGIGVNGMYFGLDRDGKLWRSDGTEVGTQVLWSGRGDWLINYNNQAYFVDRDTNTLWKSDGTLSGTVRAELHTADDPLLVTSRMFIFNGKLAVPAVRKFDGGIWLTDGTVPGTSLFARLHTYYSYDPTGEINGFAVSGGMAFFSKGADFWRTDGTYEGTVRLRESFNIHGNPSFVSLGNFVLFETGLRVDQPVLWRSDGTPTGTMPVKALGTTLWSSRIGRMSRLGDQAYFLSIDNGRNLALWQSDGTEAGTQVIKQFPGEDSFLTESEWLQHGDAIYFVTFNSSRSTLWKTDGTAVGTVALTNDFVYTPGSYLTELNGFLYLMAHGVNGQNGIWRVSLSDHTLEFVHILTPPESSVRKYIRNMRSVGDKLYILDTGGLWGSDGTPHGTISLKAANNILTPASFRGKYYFITRGADDVDGLWSSDGTVAGTQLVKSFPRSSTNHSPELYAIGDRLYIEGFSFLWISDGTAAGTVPIPTPANSPISVGNFELELGHGLLGNQAVFVAVSYHHGMELFTYATTDNGDALFGSRMIEEGASHVAIGPRLGTRRDTDEVDGLPSVKADGDDRHGSDDEDGLDVLPSLAVGETSEFNFLVNDATSNTRLYGWFDWNLDGDWNDAGEKMIAGVHVTNGNNLIALTVPNTASNGTVMARFRIGDQVSMGPIGFATSGEVEDYVFKLGQEAVIDLPNDSSNNIVIRKSHDRVEVVDATTSQVISSLALNRLSSLSVIGSDIHSDSVLVDYASGGFFAIPLGIALEGRGGNDSISVVGSTATRVSEAALPSAANESQMLTQEGGTSGWLRFTGFEGLDFRSFQAFEITGPFDLGSREITIAAAGPVQLGTLTTISGGKLIAGAVQLSSGDSLEGSGQVAARVSALSGSRIRLTGNMLLGQANASDGFASQGTLDASAYQMTLLDSNSVELGGIIYLGSLASPGTLAAPNGLTLAATATVNGHGTIETPDAAHKTLNNSGAIQGRSASHAIVLPGYLTGNGTMNWTSVTGTYHPGPGTVAITHGSVSYSGDLLLQASGATAGTQFDQLKHSGTAKLAGELVVQFLDNYTLPAGTRLPFITAVGGVSGQFSSLQLPPAPEGKSLGGVYRATEFSVELLQLTLTISSATISEQGGSATGTVERGGGDQSQALVVQLTSSDPTELSIPSSVTIPAGQSSITFNVTAIDDTLLDGNQAVTVTAQASGLGSAEQLITVTDQEALMLTLDVSSISERGGRALATVTRENTDRQLPLEVQLVSSLPGQATVPAVVTIPSGQGSVSFEISAIDDNMLDGSQTLILSVSATGYTGAQQSLTILDSEQLIIEVTNSTLSEAGVSTTLTITRSNSDTSLPLTVNLQSSDESELTVPDTVIIPANAVSVTVTAHTLDDSQLDGDQVAYVRATASGYEEATTTLTITDYELLELTLFSGTMSESGGIISGRVTRSVDDLSAELQVNLALSDTAQATVDSVVTIPPFENSVFFKIRAVDDALLDGTQVVTLSAEANGFITSRAEFSVTDVEELTLQITPNSVPEDVGTVQAIVTRSNTDTQQPVTVQLAVSRSQVIDVPAEVTIPAGQASVTFPITVLDNDLLDGTRSVAVTAGADGYRSSTQSLQVTDSEFLTIDLPMVETTENGGQIQGTVSRSNTNVSSALNVSLVSDKPGQASVLSQLTILPDQTSATFLIDVKDDSLLDGAHAVRFTATASGYRSGTTVLTVLDHETLSLTLDRSTISESAGTATATVTRSNTDRNQPLVVSLSVDTSSQIGMPASVTIPAGAASTTFVVSAIDDTLLDGTQAVQLLATASGYMDGSGSLSVTDNESLTVSISSSSVAESAGSLSAVVRRSNTNLDQPITVNLASSHTSKASVPQTVTIPAGQQEHAFTITIINNTQSGSNTNVDITATAAGYAAGSGTFTITDDDRAFPWQNPDNRFDVNDDSFITALDVLLVINAININFRLTPELPNPFFPVEYLDVSGDNVLSAIDALLVINMLNSGGQSEGEAQFELTLDMLAQDLRAHRLARRAS